MDMQAQALGSTDEARQEAPEDPESSEHQLRGKQGVTGAGVALPNTFVQLRNLAESPQRVVHKMAAKKATE
jgi:hypothetical protein